MEAIPHTPRGVLAKIARVLGVVQAQLSFRKTPQELVELIGNKAGPDSLVTIMDDYDALVEVLASITDDGEEKPVRGEPTADAKEPVRGRGRATEEPAKEPAKEPARGRGRAAEAPAKEPVRGRGRAAAKEEEEEAPPARGRGRTAAKEEPPARGRGAAKEEPAARGRGRGRNVEEEEEEEVEEVEAEVEEEVEEAPARGRGRAGPQKEPAVAGRGRGRGRAAAEEPEEPEEQPARRGRGRAAAEEPPAFDPSSLEADISALRVALEGKAEAKALANVEKGLGELVAARASIDAALTLLVNEMFFVDGKGYLTKRAVDSVLDIEDLAAYVFPE